jgi:hypothetical protein
MANNTGKITVDGITVDTKKADRISDWLILRESENIRIKAYADVQIISGIQNRIKEEAECY